MKFSNKVLELVSKIPKGSVLTYKEIAIQAGSPKAYRAVGNILNKNYNPKIPCHRVIKSDGTLGGYNRGVKQKKHLLIKERILSQEFFNRNVVKVAEDLIGKYLVRKINGEEIALMINEVEAYDGPNDLACHGRFGMTERTETMFGEAGAFYVYFVYGIHWMLNIVTGPNDYPAAVLIRGAGKFNGPAKLTKALGIDKSFNGLSCEYLSDLWIEDRGKKIKTIKKTVRIGIDYAGPVWSKKPYRFVVE